nr:ribonuclease H-like domain-containing protein [Tanacetum cinerariifolium]
MALPDKHQLKFNIHKDAKSLMEATEKRFGGNKETNKVQKTLLKQQYKNFTGLNINLKFLRSLPTEWRSHTLIWRNKTDLEDQSLDDLFNNLKIYEDEVKNSSSTNPTTQNIAFVSSENTDSTNESVSAVTSVFAATTKVPVSALSNEIDLKWQMAMLTIRARRFLQRTGRNLGANGTTSIGFDMSKVECYNCHRRGHFARKCMSPKDTRNKDTQRRNVPADEEPTNYALMAFTFSSSLNSDNEEFPVLKHVLKLILLCNHTMISLESVEARLVVYQQNENVFEKDIKLLKLDVMLRDNALVDLRKKFEKVEQERDELKLKLEIFQTSSKNLSKPLASQITDKIGLCYDNQVFNSTVFDCDELISSESGGSMPTSPVHDSETVLDVLHVEPSTTKPNKDLSQSNRPSSPIIKDWVFDSKDESEGNISYLSNFEELNEGYVAFGGNPKGSKTTGKGKIRTGKLGFDDVYFFKELKFNLFSVSQMCDKKNNVLFTDTKRIVLSSDFKLPDENHVLLRVPRENNMYYVSLKNIVSLGSLTCLFAKATLYESNIWYPKKLNAGTVRKEANSVQQYVLLPFWSSGSKDPHNTDAAAFEVKEPESAVHVSPSSCDKINKHDDKTKRKAKGKSLVEISTGVRDLSDDFEEFSDASTNRVNAASTLVTTVGPNSTNNTNTFSAAGPFNIVVSPTLRLDEKSSYVDPSQYPDDPDMPALEDIPYSDDEEDVGAEVDFSNLETNITDSPIPTTRVHKDRLVTQIIGDLSLSPQTR